MTVEQLSILAAALPSRSARSVQRWRGRAVAAAMDVIARQPEAAGTVADVVRRSGHDRDHGDLLLRDRAAVLFANPFVG
jgi:hypothetical protein